MMTGGIHVENLKKTFSGRCILKNLSLSIPEGKSMVLMGKSGSGKSVLMRCLLGLDPWDHGRITFGGKTMKFSEIQKNFLSIGVVFQSCALFEHLNVRENILLAAQSNPLNKEKLPDIEFLLSSVALPLETANRYPEELSGGMKRRVAIARALAINPSYLLFDEPTAGLDPLSSQQTNQLIRHSIERCGATALTITHDIQSAFVIGDFIGLLDEGKIVWQGSRQETSSPENPFAQKFFRAAKADL